MHGKLKHHIAILILIVAYIPTGVWGAELVNWDSREGVKRLERSQAKVDFFPLANHFESQENKLFCGIASSVIVLNALRQDNPSVTKPTTSSLSADESQYLPKNFNPHFERYSQNNVIKEPTKTKMEILGKPITLNGKSVSDYGLQLRQLAALLTSQELDVTTRVVSDTLSDATIRQELINNLKTSGDYVLINYSRKPLGQGNIGHISPLGAYDRKSDSFLVMDVNPNTAKWVWVSSKDLIAAMRTFDTVENRGYLLIKEKSIENR